MTTDNVTMKRRASDWQQKSPTVLNPGVSGWYEGGGPAVIEEKGAAKIYAAIEGAEAIAAVLMQAAIDRDDVRESPLKLCSHIEHGLLAALA